MARQLAHPAAFLDSLGDDFLRCVPGSDCVPSLRREVEGHLVVLVEPEQVFGVVEAGSFEPLRDLVHRDGFVDHLRRLRRVDDGEVVPQDAPKLKNEHPYFIFTQIIRVGQMAVGQIAFGQMSFGKTTSLSRMDISLLRKVLGDL